MQRGEDVAVAGGLVGDAAEGDDGFAMAAAASGAESEPLNLSGAIR